MVAQHRQSIPQDARVPSPPVPTARQLLLQALLVVAVVFLACGLGILTRPEHQLAAFWPTNALLLGLFARRPALASPAGWAAAALGYVAADLLTGSSLPTTLRLTAANLAGVAAGFLVFQRVRHEDRQLQHPLSMLSVLAVSAAAALAAGLAGSLSSSMKLGFLTTSGFWFSAELVCYVAILPVVLLAPAPSTLPQVLRERLARLRRHPRTVLPLLALLLTILLGVVIGGPGAIAFPVPALLWCALAYRLFTTALVTLLLCMWTLIAIATGVIDLQLRDDGPLPVISLRMGMALLAVAPLTVASVNAARNRLLATLNHAADHDALTGTLNRSAFMRRGRELAEHAQATGRPVVAMMLDIDHFKSVNDRHGHAAGDAVLTIFAQRMREHLRQDGLFGRFGGEEFAVLLPDLDTDDASTVAERLRHLASEPIPLNDGRMLDVTVSVGLASLSSPMRVDTLEQLLSQADAALYRAKAMGRNRVIA
ncbi:GGDEF domain-containing protein [Pseudoxanthomonas sp. PXM01]|uniref:GGDEF domain-containing protein n=1 Tax=Pseudoxanthomonas sp. PXM01 TaxID=2769295 RepID=UPI0017857CE2|nr:GGDEF domain-containing protein [Pseudoxanthomonas sp. PXM01]MBD9469071.1 diguanylate cyclase [Pseudoxanthomonas sp. PXM01]